MNTHRCSLALIASGAATAAAGIVVAAGVQPMTTVDGDVWSYPWTSGTFVVISLLWAALHALVIVGLLALPRARIAIAGTALLLIGELASIPVRDSVWDDASVLFVAAEYALGGVVSAIGFLVAARAAHGPQRMWLNVTGIWMVVLLCLGMIGMVAVGVAGYGLCLFAVGATMQPNLRAQPA
jgi:hypothetical protein